MKEICIVAAIKTPSGFIIRGQRHGDCIRAAQQIKALTKFEIANAIQGFITSKNRFVRRIEGRRLQDEAGIPSACPDGYMPGTLMSEDLY